MPSFQYEETRSVKLENEIFFRINPRYPQEDTQAISLILAGDISGNGPTGSYDFDVDVESIRNQIFTVRGIGFPLVPYEDTLRYCQEIWIPTGSSEKGEIGYLKFIIKKRTSYRSWIYLWNYEEGNDAKISGSWFADGFQLAEEPYDETYKPELDYSCVRPGFDSSIIFVPYEPNNFRYNGTYNATLNNAMSESKQDLYTISGSVKIKNVISDFHKIPGIGGHSAGEIKIDQGTDKEFIRVQDFRNNFSASAERYGGDATLQTLDLAYTSFRAISASVYVDRIGSGNVSASVEKVWEDIQEGNTDDPETVYFIPRCNLQGVQTVYDPVEQKKVLDLSGSYLGFIHTTTVPTVGDLLFTVNQHTPVRYVEATLYAPFLNRVYRTDKFGAIVEEFPQSDFDHPEEQ